MDGTSEDVHPEQVLNGCTQQLRHPPHPTPKRQPQSLLHRQCCWDVDILSSCTWKPVHVFQRDWPTYDRSKSMETSIVTFISPGSGMWRDRAWIAFPNGIISGAMYLKATEASQLFWDFKTDLFWTTSIPGGDIYPASSKTRVSPNPMLIVIPLKEP